MATPNTVIANDRREEAFQGFLDSHAESADPEDMASVHAEFELIHAQIIHEKHNAVRVCAVSVPTCLPPMPPQIHLTP